MKKEKQALEQSIVAHLTRLLSRDEIYKQHLLIKSMNPRLEIHWNALVTLPHLKELTDPERIGIISKIPFLKLNQSAQMTVRIEYQDRNRVILVTGITRSFLQKYLSDYNRTNYVRAEIVGQTPFWLAIQMHYPEQVLQLKKVLRGCKLALDLQNDEIYRERKRRVRIVILEEDFYTLLVDAMTETKLEAFKTCQQGQQPYKGVLYSPIQFNSRIETVREDESEETFSESNSLASDLFGGDRAKREGLVETSDQGIQAENTNQPRLEGMLPASIEITETPQESTIDSAITNGVQQQQKGIAVGIQEQSIQAMFQNSSSEVGDRESEATVVKYHQMKEWLVYFQRCKMGKGQATEIPSSIRRETHSQRNRHLFFGSLCREKRLARLD